MTSYNRAEKSALISRSNPLSYLSSPTVTVVVGEARVERFAHKALLINFSPFFEACLKPGFAEGDSLIVTFADEKEDIVDGFLDWLYTGELKNVKNLFLANIAHSYIELYAFADKLMTNGFKNAAIDGLRSYLYLTRRVVSPQCLLDIHDCRLLETKLADFLFRQFAVTTCSKNSIWYGTEMEEQTLISHSLQLKALYQNTEVAAKALEYIVRYQKENWEDPIHADPYEFHEPRVIKRCVAQNSDPTEPLTKKRKQN